MEFIKTDIEGVFIIEEEYHYDERGSFSRIFCRREFEAININKEFVQVNHSYTIKKGTFRGLHLQKPPKQESKIVRCIYGSVFDVIVDMRKNSSTYLNWISFELSKENRKMVYVPEGCAHGFQTMEDNCEMLYLHTEYYNPQYEMTIYHGSEMLNISLPLEVTGISQKDKNGLVNLKDIGVQVN